MQKETIFRLNHIKFPADPLPDLQLQLCGTTYPNRNYVIRRQIANLACIEFIVSGKGHVTVGEEQFSPRCGRYLFFACRRLAPLLQ